MDEEKESHQIVDAEVVDQRANEEQLVVRTVSQAEVSQGQPAQRVDQWKDMPHGKQPYTLIDFVLAFAGILVLLVFGTVGAGIEYLTLGWYSMFHSIGGGLGGAAASMGGIITTVFFMNIISKQYYNGLASYQRKHSYGIPNTFFSIVILVIQLLSGAENWLFLFSFLWAVRLLGIGHQPLLIPQ